MVPSKNKKEIYEDIKKINLNLKKKYNVKETNLKKYELDPLTFVFYPIIKIRK
jgi:hypothetical protein